MGDEGRIAELEQVLAVRDAEVAELRELVSGLRARLVELERERSRNSGNSGRAPSGDTLPERSAQNEARLSRAERRRLTRAELKERTKAKEPKRRPGKQPGDEGKTLEMVESPDVVETLVPPACSGCGGSLEEAPVVGVERRQVFDVPEIRAISTEHRAESRRCGCGHTTAAVFPPEARGPACWGPGVRALASYLLSRQHIPIGRAAEFLSDVLGAPVSTGFLAGIPGEAEAALGPFLSEVRRQLIESGIVHFDETGARVSGTRHWFHVASNGRITLLMFHPKRGRAAIDDMGVLGALTGTAVHDGWKPYWAYDCAHAICGAHLLRDLAGVAEVASQTAWADGMADLLVEAKGAVEAAVAAGRSGLSRNELKSLRRRYSLLVKAGRAVNPDPVGRKRDALERASYNLLRRFDTQRDDICRSWTDPRVPFDNNQAERDLRMVKLQQKISGCFRTPEGASAFCATRSYLQTAAKHRLNLLGVLKRLFTGDPWIPAVT